MITTANGDKIDLFCMIIKLDMIVDKIIKLNENEQIN